MARRKLLTNQIELWGQKVAVDWAEPEPEVDEEVMSKVQFLKTLILYLTRCNVTIIILYYCVCRLRCYTSET